MPSSEIILTWRWTCGQWTVLARALFWGHTLVEVKKL